MFSRRKGYLIIIMAALLLAALACPGPLLAEETAETDADSRDSLTPPEGYSILFLGRNYDVPLADARYPYTGILIFGDPERDTFDGFEGAVSFYGGLVRHYDKARQRTWQLGVEACFFALFHMDGSSLRSEATDYRISLAYSYSKPTWNFVARFGHLSSHPGDWYLQNVDPAASTIYWEDLMLLGSWHPTDWLRLYGGGSWYVTHTDMVGAGELQGGFEFWPDLNTRVVKPYLACDFRFKEVNDFRLTADIQGGIKIIGFENRLAVRIFGFYHYGDNPASVFMRDEVQRFGIGFAVDY